MNNQASKRLSSDLENQDSMEPTKRGKGSLKPPDSSLWICSNLACRATQITVPRFCKRCSCCICHRFDDHMDPSLWLKCTPESGAEGSCGYSCHVECALRHGKVGVLQMQLDGGYSCASCSEVSSIIGCWMKQLKIALDTNRVDVLCYRVLLCYRLLNGTSKFSELHKFIEDLKAMLEMEVGPINVTTGKMSRPHSGRLHAASHVQALCKLALTKAEELLGSHSSSVSNPNAAEGSVPCSSVPETKSRADSKLKSILKRPRVVLDKKKELQGSCSGTGTKKSTGVGDAQPETLKREGPPLPDLNEEYQEADVKPKPAPPTTSDGSRGFDDSLKTIVKTIRQLEHDGHVTENFRMKFLTWFGLKAKEHERRTVQTFLQTMVDDPKGLAGQLLDAFSTSMVIGDKP